MDVIQLDLLEDKVTEPTIGTMRPGQAFRRVTGTERQVKQRSRYIYMAVDICGDIQYNIKDTSERSVLIVNLGTGRVYSANPHEVIEPLPYAAVLEDVTQQVVRVTSKKK